MDSEHRHELEENDLAKVLGRWAKQLETYSNQIVAGVIGVAVISAVVIYFSRTASSVSAQAWQELSESETTEQYAEVALTYENSAAGAWAKLGQARGLLNEGIRNSVSNRPVANENLVDAVEAFKEVLSSPVAVPEVREQAQYGLAVALESQSAGDTQPAIDAYNDLISNYPASRFRSVAEERVTHLQEPNAKEFYAWFSEQSPTPADRPLPRDFSNLSESLNEGLGAGVGSTLNPFDGVLPGITGSMGSGDSEPAEISEEDQQKAADFQKALEDGEGAEMGTGIAPEMPADFDLEEMEETLSEGTEEDGGTSTSKLLQPDASID